MKLGISLLIAVVAFAGARYAKQTIEATQSEETTEPFTPSPAAAPFVSLGYREAASDVLFVRLLGYINDEHSRGPAVANLAEAIATLDPHFLRIYDLGANAMTIARSNVDQDVYLRAIALLEKGMKYAPQDWRLPYLAGQIYTQDLRTEDPQQQRAWTERGLLLIESAIRKPGAPPTAAYWAAITRTKLGQHERAAQGLREMILLTSDRKTRERLLAKLAELEKQDAEALGVELESARIEFLKCWKQDRRDLPASFYVLLGKRVDPSFDLVTLATGGRDLISSVVAEHGALE